MFIKSGNKQPTIRVAGIGGFGRQTVKELMLSSSFKDIDFITIGPATNTAELDKTMADIVLPNNTDKETELEESYLKWGEIALENKETIKDHLISTDILFICCNEGRGFSSGVAPVVADIARECGALVIAVVNKPFKLEGKKRDRIARKGIELIKQTAGTTIVVNKQGIFENIGKGILFAKAYSQVKMPIYQSIELISKFIRVSQLINIDLADLKVIMGNGSLGFIGEGVGTGDMNERAQQAIDQAFSFPLTNNSINEAENILFNITGGKDLGMDEIDNVANIITQSAHKDANIKFGVTTDEAMTGKIRVSVIATSMSTNLSEVKYSSKPTDFDTPTFLRKNNSRVMKNYL